MNFNEKLSILRKKKGYSQEELAEYIGVSRQTISNWELNETTPNLEQLKELSKTLNISIDELLNNDIKNILEDKINKTEKNTSKIKKLLKFIFVGFIVLLIIDIITFIYFFVNRIEPFNKVEQSNITYKI